MPLCTHTCRLINLKVLGFWNRPRVQAHPRACSQGTVAQGASAGGCLRFGAGSFALVRGCAGPCKIRSSSPGLHARGHSSCSCDNQPCLQDCQMSPGGAVTLRARVWLPAWLCCCPGTGWGCLGRRSPFSRTQRGLVAVCSWALRMAGSLPSRKEARMEHCGSPVPLLETLNLSKLLQTSVFLSLEWGCDSPFSWVLVWTGDTGECPLPPIRQPWARP